jgi:hypothetical protein
MDSTILQLFAADEILQQLARKKLTGCFKVFTPLESSTVYFKKGMIVAAVKGDTDGETALKEILDWKEALFAWEPEVAAPIPPLRPVLIKVDAFLNKVNGSLTKTTVTNLNGKIIGSTQSVIKGSTTTKSITATAETRLADESDLLHKHRLTLISVADPDKRYRLARATNVIGRNPGCDIMVPDPSISRQHCVLQLTDRGLHVKDLNTVNGTKINGTAMKEGFVNVGDKLTVGHIAFVVEQAEN